MATHLLSDGAHLLARGGHLVVDNANCQGDCCPGCLACSISGRVATITVSGLTSVTGNVVTDVNDLCGECPGLNGAYGGDFLTSTAPRPNTYLCGAYGPNNATECRGFLIESFQPSLWALYNASGSTLNYTNPCGSGTIAVPNGYTYLYALLQTSANISGGGNVCTSCACFSILQAGKVACPFSGLSLPLASLSGSCFCDLSGVSVTAGVA